MTMLTSPLIAPFDASAPSGAGGLTPVLRANLAALSRRSPHVARALLDAPPPAPGLLDFAPTDDQTPSATLGGVSLASRRRPLEEARRLAETLDPVASGCAVVLGFGLGYHVGALADRMMDVGVVAVFEPDLSLLRGVLERIDHSRWLARGNVAIFDDPADRARITQYVQGWEAPLAVGAQIIEHAPSRARLGARGVEFARAFTDVVATVRTHVITTMMQTEVTVRNGLMNADHYARWPGIGELAGLAQGRPAVVVSAGPSLRRNLARLKQPGLRDRCLIICVQTVLKQLLREGIRPHFVTALDHHEISARFYEGLTAADVEGVTLVAEPKANPAILEAFPGAKRLIADEFVETVLGPAVDGLHAPLKPGATVAHLAYYLARHMGADPVILVGQDLAFTDGQYYARDAAIHRVWAGELNPFNTLEMMEWQRIMRMRGNLHEMTDHLGRKVYSDDQMVAYLHQFERDFMEDATPVAEGGRGLMIIDATEGGVAKAYTTRLALADALERFAAWGTPLPPIPVPASRPMPPGIKRRLHAVRNDTRTLARLSRETTGLLSKLADCLDTPGSANALIHQIHALRDRVQKLDPAYALVHRFNQTGTFKRFKADRAMKLDPGLSGVEMQRKQVERDAMNVGWIADSADALEDLLDATISVFEGGPRRTRDVAPADDSAPRTGATKAGCTPAGLMVLDFAGRATELTREVLGAPVAELTVRRLARCKALCRLVIVTDDPARARALAGAARGLSVSVVESDLAGSRERRRAVMQARAWSARCWRGGVGGMTVYDEACDPRTCAEAMARENLDAALLIDPAWCLIDPSITGAVIERHAEGVAAGRNDPMTFTQAAPGLAPCVVSRKLVDDLARGQGENSMLATIAGVLAYRPLNARADPVAMSCCVPVPPSVRDALTRFIPDHPGWELVERAAAAEPSPDQLDAAALCERLSPWGAAVCPWSAPADVTLMLKGHAGCLDERPVDLLLGEIAQLAWAPALTIRAEPGHDCLDHPSFVSILRRAAAPRGARVHVRTELCCTDTRFEAAFDALTSCASVISIDTHANAAATYERLTGRDAFAQVLRRADRLLKARRPVGGLLTPFIVPRITRRDAVYEEIEAFFDKALLVAGAGVIDQLPAPIPGDRIEPLGKPLGAAVRDAFSRLVVHSTGDVFADERGGTEPIGRIGERPLAEIWSALTARRAESLSAHGADHPDLWTGW